MVLEMLLRILSAIILRALEIQLGIHGKWNTLLYPFIA